MDKQEVDPEQYPNKVSFEFMTHYSEMITMRIPLMAQAVMRSSYVGLYDMSPDRHPIIDSLSEKGADRVYASDSVQLLD